MTPDEHGPVLVAGIGGASLGTEILKALRLAGYVDVFGCDVSQLAYGHYDALGAVETFCVDRDDYTSDVLALCARLGIRAVIPGGEQPLHLLSRAADVFRAQGIHIAANDAKCVALCSDKSEFFGRLSQLGLPTPWTKSVNSIEHFDSLQGIPAPCIIKPSEGTGGSRFVFLAADAEEARAYTIDVLRHTQPVLVQEYIPIDEGEFTIGVLNLPDGRRAGSVAMRRAFHSKLSVLTNSSIGLVSSGYSQGRIDVYPELREQAEAIATAFESKGPFNVQGRVRDGLLIPFEVNPRFSASTFLRAMAGFNEIDVYLRAVLRGEEPVEPTIRPGNYLRSLTEVFVPDQELMR